MAIEISENRQKFDCQQCSCHHYCGEDKELFPQSKGSASFDLFEIKRAGLSIKLNSCLVPMVTRRTNYFLQMYGDYKRGNLLGSGGVNDQPNLYVQTMRFLSGY